MTGCQQPDRWLNGDAVADDEDPRPGSVQVAVAARSDRAQHRRHEAMFAVCLSYIPLGVTLATGILLSLHTDNSPNSYKMLA